MIAFEHEVEIICAAVAAASKLLLFWRTMDREVEKEKETESLASGTVAKAANANIRDRGSRPSSHLFTNTFAINGALTEIFLHWKSLANPHV